MLTPTINEMTPVKRMLKMLNNSRNVPTMVTNAIPAAINPKVESLPRYNNRAPKPIIAPMTVPMSGNFIPVSIVKATIKPTATTAPRIAPRIPIKKLLFCIAGLSRMYLGTAGAGV